MNIRQDSSGLYSGDILNEQGQTDQLEEIRWNESERRLIFRRKIDVYEWYSGTIIEGIIVGRFSHSTDTVTEPRLNPSIYRNHFTGWNSNYIDGKNIVPRVYDVTLDGNYRGVNNSKCQGLLRIDRVDNHMIGRLKIYRVGNYNADTENKTEFPVWSCTNSIDSLCGEELEYDLNVTRWDGDILEFSRIDDRPNQHWVQNFTGRANGHTITGTFTHTGMPNPLNWGGIRAQVLSYGLAVKSPEAREKWQERTRRQLHHLMMTNNPAPLSSSGGVKTGPEIAPVTNALERSRDDNATAHDQSYRLRELFFQYFIDNPYDRLQPLKRKIHGWLAVPTNITSGQKYPAVLAVNGHAGSAKQVIMPDSSTIYWYGDSFARRGYVVLAIDISHRGFIDQTLQGFRDCPPERPYPAYGPSPLYGPPRLTVDQWAPLGDDPCNKNGPHPFIGAEESFESSDWEENGERAWDVMHALDYLLNRPYVDSKRIIMTGLSLGGEVATIVGALDPRISMVIPACWSPDSGVFYFISHGCAHWVYANSREYLGISDYHALIAPRPLIVQTGKTDNIYSKVQSQFFSDHFAYFAGDKTTAGITLVMVLVLDKLFPPIMNVIYVNRLTRSLLQRPP